MAVKKRAFQILRDFDKVSDFLINNYDRKYKNGYFYQPFFEYGIALNGYVHTFSHRNAIWEENGGIAAIVFYEMSIGEAFLVAKKGYEHLKPEMLKYAEENMSAETDEGKGLSIWTTDAHLEDIDMLRRNGCTRIYAEDINEYDYSQGFESDSLPAGYIYVSGDQIDWKKADECTWLGFADGVGDIPPNRAWWQLEHRFCTPNARKDWVTAIAAPDEKYACFAGMWMDSKNEYAYLEPLCTVPAHRRKGLAKAMLMHLMSKTAEAGATFCNGGSGEFYNAIGFEKQGQRELWKKKWRV